MRKYFRWLSPTHPSTPETVQPEQKSLGITSLFSVSGGGHARWSSADYSSLARKGFMNNPIVYRCVRLISETAAAVPLLIYENEQELDAHPMLKLLARPNSRQGGQEFFEGLMGHLLVAGNAYVEMVQVEETPREMHALRPDRVKAICNGNGWVEGYEYAAGNNKTRHMIDDAGVSPILHLSLFHPLDDQVGFPPLQAALMALDVHNSANQWNKALLDNSARPSGALVYSSTAGSNLSDEQFARLKGELEEGYTGASRAGRPMLLEGGLDWKAMGYSPKDMDFVDARNAAARDIALAFGVPPMLLGIPGDNTYSNYQEANRAFTRQTMLPLLKRTLDSFNHWLQPRFGNDLRLTVDEDRVEGLASERELVWKRLATADFLSDDEKRVAVGYSPLEGGAAR